MVHEPRIASHVGSQYRRQPALDPDWSFFHHAMQSNPQRTVRRINGECQTRLTGCPSKLMSVLALFGHAETA
jgi:hypothetical protein